MLKIYSADVCPFAHRARAMLTYLEVPFEEHHIDLANRDPEFLKISPTGRVPLIVDGDFKLYESQVICQYLAEKHDWAAAWHDDVQTRARQRLAMKQWDEQILGGFYRTLKKGVELDDDQVGKVKGEIRELAKTVQAMNGNTECLLGFHVASFWTRMGWLRESAVVALLDENIPLRAWLDRCAEMPSVKKTAPERESTIAAYRDHYVNAA